MANIIISSLSSLPSQQEVEIVERKGLGHPDTLCDIAAESVSNKLSKFYLKQYGSIMHYNLDKALLIGGNSEPAYKGGEILDPIEFIIAGRATARSKDELSKIEEIAEEAIREHFDHIIRHIDINRHLEIKVKIRPGSKELVELYERIGEGSIPLSNDTSIGCGFYPLDELEETVYKTEKFLNSSRIKKEYPFIGEDIKVMGIRMGSKICLTLAIAIVDRYVTSLDEYKNKIKEIKKIVLDLEWINADYKIDINTSDSYEKESIYLTVSGTSAEGGDDGQVGRGNRSNGLITPDRPMTVEAVAGKNPVCHVGKIYNLFANELSKEIVESGCAGGAAVSIISQIGKPINQPQAMELKVKDMRVEESHLLDTAEEMLADLPLMWKKIIEGKFQVA